MSVNHHGNEPSENMKRFIEETTGVAKREFPNGRIAWNDDGSITYAIATDDRKRVIRIAFPKPVQWIGLSIADAEQLRDQLTERLLSLRGIEAKT